MDKETAFSMGLAAASFVPGPVGLLARGASTGILAYQGWKHRDEIASVVNRTIGVASAQAQSPVQRPGESRPRRATTADPGRGLTHAYGNGPRLPSGKGAAAPAAATAPQPAMPAPAAQSLPPAPDSTQDANRTASAFDQRRRALEKEEEVLRNAVNREVNARGGYGPQAAKASDRLKEITKERGEIDKDEAAAKKVDTAQRSAWLNYAAPAALAVGGFIGWKIAGAVGARAVQGAMTSALHINTLGKAAKALTASKGVLTGTPKGDALKGIVAAARPASASVARAGEHLGTAATWLDRGTKALMVEGAATTAASYLVDDPKTAAVLRGVGMVSLGASAGLKFGGIAMKASGAPKPSARGFSAIGGAKARLEREAAGGAMRASKHRVAAEVAGAKKELIAAEASTKIGAVRAEHAVERVAQSAPKAVIAGPRLTKAEAAARAARHADAGKQAAATRAAKLEKARQGAFQLGKNRGAGEAMAQIAHPPALAARARELGIRGRASMSVHQLRSAVAKVSARRVRGAGVHRGGKGFANPKVQASAQRALRHRYAGPSE